MVGTQITKEQAQQLEKRGVAIMFDAPKSSALGFFDAKEKEPHDVVLIVRDDGYYVRAYEDLVRSNDGIFVGFIEDGTPPEFDDVFEVREF